MQNIKKRNLKIDILKAIAILAVILYHTGLLKYGYFGVDIFLVINGFLIAKNLKKQIANGEYNYLKFIIKKVKQFWPLLLFAGLISLLIGYNTMLPDDYENLAESVVATNFFSNNILAAITVKNYWDIWNDFKPLMHTWYMGVLLQSYLLIGIIPCLSKIFNKYSKKKIINMMYILLFFLSLIIYLIPYFDSHIKFYFLPFRLFEILLGVLLAYNLDNILNIIKENKKVIILEVISLILLILLLVCNAFEYNSIRLLVVCITTAILLLLSEKKDIKKNPITSILSYIGHMSYSLFIWHQIILAFIRYSIKVNFVWYDYILIYIIIAIISILSYELIEKNIKKMQTKVLLPLIIIILIVSTLFALFIYSKAGVVRNVPELDIKVENVHRNMHAEYNDRGYTYDKNFPKNDKINVLVIGNSFGRDWVNILLESDISNKINISYVFCDDTNNNKIKILDRINEAEYTFYAISDNGFNSIPKYLIKYYKEEKLYLIGNKNFGYSNGIIYAKRNTKKYYSQKILLDDDYYANDKKLKEKYNNHYISMIDIVSDTDNRVKVFTDSKKFISQDTRHLTRAGAKYYAKLIDFKNIFNKYSDNV